MTIKPTTPPQETTIRTGNAESNIVIADSRSGRARKRVLTGEEEPDGMWQFEGWRVAVCGWADGDFAKAYRKYGSPQADAWVRVTAPDGGTFLVLKRAYPRSLWVAVRDDIGYAAYDAVKASKSAQGEAKLTPDVESELKAFCRKTATDCFEQAGRQSDSVRATVALRAHGSLPAELVEPAMVFARSAWAFRMTVSLDEVVEAFTTVESADA
jgi:hypothetical protein